MTKSEKLDALNCDIDEINRSIDDCIENLVDCNKRNYDFSNCLNELAALNARRERLHAAFNAVLELTA